LPKLIFRDFPEISGTPRIKKGEIEKHSRKIAFFEGIFPQISRILENVPWGKNFQNFSKVSKSFRKFSKFSENSPRKFSRFWTRPKTKI
jgi:hypothetical protein